jgi:hypothetical protein
MESLFRPCVVAVDTSGVLSGSASSLTDVSLACALGALADLAKLTAVTPDVGLLPQLRVFRRRDLLAQLASNAPNAPSPAPIGKPGTAAGGSKAAAATATAAGAAPTPVPANVSFSTLIAPVLKCLEVDVVAAKQRWDAKHAKAAAAAAGGDGGAAAPPVASPSAKGSPPASRSPSPLKRTGSQNAKTGLGGARGATPAASKPGTRPTTPKAGGGDGSGSGAGDAATAPLQARPPHGDLPLHGTFTPGSPEGAAVAAIITKLTGLYAPAPGAQPPSAAALPTHVYVLVDVPSAPHEWAALLPPEASAGRPLPASPDAVMAALAAAAAALPPLADAPPPPAPAPAPAAGKGTKSSAGATARPGSSASPAASTAPPPAAGGVPAGEGAVLIASLATWAAMLAGCIRVGAAAPGSDPSAATQPGMLRSDSEASLGASGAGAGGSSSVPGTARTGVDSVAAPAPAAAAAGAPGASPPASARSGRTSATGARSTSAGRPPSSTGKVPPAGGKPGSAGGMGSSGSAGALPGLADVDPVAAVECELMRAALVAHGVLPPSTAAAAAGGEGAAPLLVAPPGAAGALCWVQSLIAEAAAEGTQQWTVPALLRRAVALPATAADASPGASGAVITLNQLRDLPYAQIAGPAESASGAATSAEGSGAALASQLVGAALDVFALRGAFAAWLTSHRVTALPAPPADGCTLAEMSARGADALASETPSGGFAPADPRDGGAPASSIADIAACLYEQLLTPTVVSADRGVELEPDPATGLMPDPPLPAPSELDVVAALAESVATAAALLGVDFLSMPPERGATDPADAAAASTAAGEAPGLAFEFWAPAAPLGGGCARVFPATSPLLDVGVPGSTVAPPVAALASDGKVGEGKAADVDALGRQHLLPPSDLGSEAVVRGARVTLAQACLQYAARAFAAEEWLCNVLTCQGGVVPPASAPGVLAHSSGDTVVAAMRHLRPTVVQDAAVAVGPGDAAVVPFAPTVAMHPHGRAVGGMGRLGALRTGSSGLVGSFAGQPLPAVHHVLLSSLLPQHLQRDMAAAITAIASPAALASWFVTGESPTAAIAASPPSPTAQGFLPPPSPAMQSLQAALLARLRMARGVAADRESIAVDDWAALWRSAYAVSAVGAAGAHSATDGGRPGRAEVGSAVTELRAFLQSGLDGALLTRTQLTMALEQLQRRVDVAIAGNTIAAHQRRPASIADGEEVHAPDLTGWVWYLALTSGAMSANTSTQQLHLAAQSPAAAINGVLASLLSLLASAPTFGTVLAVSRDPLTDVALAMVTLPTPRARVVRSDVDVALLTALPCVGAGSKSPTPASPLTAAVASAVDPWRGCTVRPSLLQWAAACAATLPAPASPPAAAPALASSAFLSTGSAFVGLASGSLPPSAQLAGSPPPTASLSAGGGGSGSLAHTGKSFFPSSPALAAAMPALSLPSPGGPMPSRDGYGGLGPTSPDRRVTVLRPTLHDAGAVPSKWTCQPLVVTADGRVTLPVVEHGAPAKPAAAWAHPATTGAYRMLPSDQAAIAATGVRPPLPIRGAASSTASLPTMSTAAAAAAFASAAGVGGRAAVHRIAVEKDDGVFGIVPRASSAILRPAGAADGTHAAAVAARGSHTFQAVFGAARHLSGAHDPAGVSGGAVACTISAIAAPVTKADRHGATLATYTLPTGLAVRVASTGWVQQVRQLPPLASATPSAQWPHWLHETSRTHVGSHGAVLRRLRCIDGTDGYGHLLRPDGGVSWFIPAAHAPAAIARLGRGAAASDASVDGESVLAAALTALGSAVDGVWIDIAAATGVWSLRLTAVGPGTNPALHGRSLPLPDTLRSALSTTVDPDTKATVTQRVELCPIGDPLWQPRLPDPPGKRPLYAKAK